MYWYRTVPQDLNWSVAYRNMGMVNIYQWYTLNHSSLLLLDIEVLEGTYTHT